MTDLEGVYTISLGRSYGIVSFYNFVISGRLAIIFKNRIEDLKLRELRNPAWSSI